MVLISFVLLLISAFIVDSSVGQIIKLPNLCFKGLVHQKMKKFCHLLTLVSFQTRKTVVHLLNTNEDLFDEI